MFKAHGTGAQDRARARPQQQQPLPRADVLVVTWTVDEGHALSRVLTPGKDFLERLPVLHAQLRADLQEDAQG